ncbi:putative baseplate assembly protein [Amycolatopsis sp. NPDC049252]|uniref:putative baseplate assembly protein n=1 Tax=Amycolatopsis sp. NPDC049252 TaxID=3363933 RepID=UPI00371511EE
MALPTPNLDDRRFPDLMADALRMVRQHCPEWTDHTPSDPGVTLIEAFAFLVDQLFRRLNQVPDRLHVKFLDLIGVRLLPPTPARTDVTFWLSAPAVTGMTIPAGTEVGTLGTEAVDPVVFATERDFTAVVCELAGVRTRAADADAGVDRGTELRAGSVPAFSPVPRPGDSLLVALDVAAPRCAVRLRLDSHVDGIGVDPGNPPLVWEAHDGTTWHRCRVLIDGTGGLNRPGDVVLDVPGQHRMSLLDGLRAGWLRARVVATDPGRPGYRDSPTLSGVTACTVGVSGPVRNARSIREEHLGTSDGSPGQVFAVGSRPVLAGAGDPVVQVSSDTGWQQWHPVGHFAASGPDDRHFVLDAHAGEITFGPLVRHAGGGAVQHGAVPERGAAVRVRDYAVGGGTAGNVGAGTITTLRSSIPFVAEVGNATSATGGTDAETVAQARDRGGVALRTTARAVTAEDYEVLARQAVPEAARIRCITAGDAGLPSATVKVLVVPAAPDDGGKVRLADLVPPDETLARLAEHLDRVRLVGTTVLVEPPRYRGLTVVARLVARPRLDTVDVRADALAALARYLNPLPGGGPDGRGWPFGRAVRLGEIHALLHQVRGVDVVEDVRLFSANPVTRERGAEADRIELEPNSLVFSFDHQVRVEAHQSGGTP